GAEDGPRQDDERREELGKGRRVEVGTDAPCLGGGVRVPASRRPVGIGSDALDPCLDGQQAEGDEDGGEDVDLGTDQALAHTVEPTTGRDSAIAPRIVSPCASRYDGRTATSSAAVTAGTSSRRPVNTTRWAIRRSRACCSSSDRLLPSPTTRR